MAADVVSTLGKKCLLVLDAYFAAAPVFAILQQVQDGGGQRLVHIVTRAKSNVVAYQDTIPQNQQARKAQKIWFKNQADAGFRSESRKL